MGVEQTDIDIEWIVANKGIRFWKIYYFGIPLNFIVLFFIFYFIVFPFWSNLFGAVIVYLIISTISSIISAGYLYVLCLWIYPHQIGFSKNNLFLKNKYGSVRNYYLTDIKLVRKKNKDTFQMKMKRQKGTLEFHIDLDVIDTAINTYEKYKKQLEKSGL